MFCGTVLLWHGHMHGNICDTFQARDVDELKQRLMKIWRGLGQSVSDDATDE